MAKVRITLTNGAAPEDIAAAIGKFVAQQGEKSEGVEKASTPSTNNIETIDEIDEE